MKLSFPLPIPDPSSPYLILMSHESLLITQDFEMTQKVRMEYYTKDGEELGIPLLDSIQLDPNLTADQKGRMLNQWKPFFREVSTRGFFVDMTTLELVASEGGIPPENSMPEKMLWINVLSADVPGEKLSEQIKNMLMQSMSKMIARKRI
tara:strand:- start:165 stop:614 length:450 start_codon:yes stop_codon:yes gene_type:complete